MLVNAITSSILTASPEVSVESTHVWVDTVLQGKVLRIRQVFSVRNTGDSILRIGNVTAG